MTVNPLRWGIIGPGKIARKFAQAMTAVEDGVLYAVASRDPERAQAFSKEFGAKVAYGAYEQIVDDPEVDVIYVSTPHRFHFENAMLCLQAGKPVLCEKPLTVTSREAEVLFQTAQAKAIFFMEALWSRYLPIYQVIREWLDKDLIGEPRLVSSTFGIIGNPDPEWRMFNANLAGGALLDLGVYNISLSQWVLRKNPVSFLAQGIIGATNVDELTSAHLFYEGGVVSQFTCNLISRNSNDMFVYGTDGHIHIHTSFWTPESASLWIGGRESIERRPFRKNGFEYQIEEATTCIRDGKLESPRMTHADTLANMQLMDAIREEIGLKYPFE